MKIIKTVLLSILSVAAGALFLYSAYTKAFPVYTFEYTMVEYIGLPWMFAALAARIFIGIEAGMGLLMVLNMYGKRKWVLKTALAILLLFNIYLVYLWARFGNNVNCGCFGDAIWMNPSASLIKNVILMGVLGMLLWLHKGFQNRWTSLIVASAGICSIVLPLIILNMPLGQPDWLKNKGYQLDMKPLYTITEEKKEVPSIDLNKGKYVIAFLSPSCSHCRTAAYKMHLMKDQDPSLPLFFVIGGNTSDLTDFWKTSKAQGIPYTRVDKDNFLKYTGGSFPVIVWVNNGKVEAKVDYNNLERGAIESWIRK